MKAKTKIIVHLSPSEKQMLAAKEFLKVRNSVQWSFNAIEAIGKTAPFIVEDKNSISSFKRGKWRTEQHASHIIGIPNYLEISKNRKLKTRIFWSPFSKKIEKKKERLPDNFFFDKDEFGVKIVKISSGADYHPTKDEWKNLSLIELILFLEKNEKTSLLRKEEKKNQEKLLSFFQKEKHKNTRIVLSDSLRAGNCLWGSLAFAEKYGLKKEDVSRLNCPGMRGDILLRSGNERAKNAVFQAYQRETLVCI